MSNREELIKELQEWAYGNNKTMMSIYKVADLMIEDRKRVVDPLVEYKKNHYGRFESAQQAIDQCLKNAGEI